MTNDPGNVSVPPPAPPAVKKSHVGLIVGAVVVVGVIWMMAGGGHSGGGPSGSAPAAGSDATAAADAPAASGGNPLIGKWNLVDSADAAYCPTTEEFTADTSKWTQNGQTSEMKPIYSIQAGGQKVTVGYGTSYIGDWTVNGPDDLTLGQVGPPPYGVPSFCKYHRM